LITGKPFKAITGKRASTTLKNHDSKDKGVGEYGATPA
jgi:hypothetical protein